MAMLRILVAEQDESVRHAVVSALASHPGWEVCGESSDGQETVAQVTALRPDVVVLGVNLANLSGLEATRRMRRSYLGQKVVMLSATDDEQVVQDAIAAGARGFLLHADAAHDVAAAVESVQQGRLFFTGRVAELVAQGYLRGARGKKPAGPRLTARQREAAELLSQGMKPDEVALILGQRRDARRVVHTALTYTLAGAVIVISAALAWTTFNRNIDPRLSVIDKVLVSLKLKEAPPATDQGNPSTKVWIDVHTGLYYCPGAQLYGKTLKGRYAKQRDAQLDQFQPATRQPCE